MCFGKASVSHTNDNSTENYNWNPTNPSWVTGGIGSLAGNLTSLAGQNPQSFVAGPSALETQAGTTASYLTPNNATYGDAVGLDKGIMNTAAPQMTATTGTAASLLPNLQSYLSPYVNDVVNSSLADYNFGAGQQRAGQALSLAGDSTFGGSGGAIAQSMTDDAINRGRASLVSDILNQGYGQAATMANQDADRRQQMTEANMSASNSASLANQQAIGQMLGLQTTAANNMVGAANDQTTAQLADLSTQSQIGQILQAIQQAQSGAPLTVANSLAGDWGTLPLSLFTGRTGTDNKSGSSTSEGLTVGAGKGG